MTLELTWCITNVVAGGFLVAVDYSGCPAEWRPAVEGLPPRRPPGCPALWQAEAQSQCGWSDRALLSTTIVMGTAAQCSQEVASLLCEVPALSVLKLVHLLLSTSFFSFASSSSLPPYPHLPPPPPLNIYSCRWFTHFYAWGLIWNLSILTLYLLSCMAGLPSSPDPLTAVLGPVIGPLVGVDLELACRSETAGGGITQKQFDVAVVLCLVCVQVARRLYECLFVSVFSPDGSMHVLHYIMGLYFYSALGPTALLHLTSGTLS